MRDFAEAVTEFIALFVVWLPLFTVIGICSLVLALVVVSDYRRHRRERRWAWEAVGVLDAEELMWVQKRIEEQRRKEAA